MNNAHHNAISDAIEALEYSISKADSNGYLYARDRNTDDFTYVDIDDQRQSLTKLKALRDAAPDDMRNDLYSMCGTLKGCDEFQRRHKEAASITRRKLAKLLHEAIGGDDD